MKIDAHQHFWHYNNEEYDWINDDMNVLKRDFLANDLDPLLHEKGIKGCVAVQARQTLEENRFLLELSDHHAIIKGVVGWFDLLSPSLEEDLETIMGHPKFKGMRHILQAEPKGFMIQDDFVSGVVFIGNKGLTYDLLTHEDQLEEVLELVSLLPEMPLVIDHISKPRIANKSFDNWAHYMRRLAAYDYIYVKLSGMITEANWFSWEYDDFKPYVQFCLDLFGPDRLMFGSDWPVCTLAGSYSDVYDLLMDCIRELSTDEQELILGETAANFYNIK